MLLTKRLKAISGLCELILGIPVYGGLVILYFNWAPLVAMLVLHIVTLLFANKEEQSSMGSKYGIIASCLGWVPILGMILHIFSAFTLLNDIVKITNPTKKPLNQ